MVVKVYNKSDVSNKFDTEQTVLEKIAMELNTVPKYLNIEKSDDPNEIIVDDILGDIYEKDFSQENIEVLKDVISRYPILIDELIQIWISTVKFKQNIFGYRIQLLDDFLKSINYEGIDNIERFLEIKSEEIIRTISDEIEKNKKRVINTTKLFSTFDNFREERERNELDIEKSLYEIKLDIPSESISLLEIFNMLNTNLYVPFIGYKNYYKIYKSIPKSKGWETIPIPTIRSKKHLEDVEEIEETNSIEDSTNMVKICVLKRNSHPSEEQAELIDIRNYYSIVIVELREDGNYYILLEHEILPSNITNDGYINRVLSIFPSNIGVSEPNILKVTATFDIINQVFDSNIFSDLVFNNPIFSIFLTLKETIQTIKSRYNLVYNHPYYGSCVVSLNQKTITRQLAGQKAVTQPSVRIRVRNGNIKTSEECASAFSKFFALYDIEKEKIIKFYKNYIPSFSEKLLTIQEKDNEPLKLRDIVPDLFVGGTSRLCDTLPKIVSKEEAETKYGEGRYMIYPKTPEEGPQYHYVCDDDKLIPSLRDNPLSSKYKELPCCHQTLNPVFLKYYNMEGADRLDRQAKYQRLITTKKFLNPGQYGVIPDNLKSLFLFFDGFQNRSFGRSGLGIRSSKSSFLECIMKALKIGIFQNEDDELTDDEINLSIKTERLKLSKKAQETGICSQEFYNYTLDEMVKEIQDIDIYLDPRKTVKLLEEEYGCNIYIFTRNDNDAFMVIPNHIHGHLYYANKWSKTIIVFDHNGSESDHATYNRCELISRWVSDKFNEGEIVFDTNDKFIMMISSLYFEMARTYFGNEKITPFILPRNFENVTSQYLDSYGKCRVLEINQNNINFTLYCTPIPPLYTERLNDIIIHRPTLHQVLEFCAQNSMAITSLGINDDNLIEEVNSIFDQIKFSIPIQITDIVQGPIPLKTGLFYTYKKEKDISSLKSFTKNRQNSRFIIEYSYWLFSKFLQEKNITNNLTIEMVKDFIKNKTKIDENFVYDKIARIFTLSNSSGIIRSGKLIFSSKELRQKIYYSLSLKISQNPNSLLSYKDRLSIKNYFDTVSEFDQNNKQVILNEGIVSFYTWSDYRFTNYKIYKTPTDDQNQYFYQNETVENGKIHLVVNTDTLEKAAFISNKWSEEGRVILPDKKTKTVEYIDNGLDYYYVKSNNDILQFNTSDNAQIKVITSALTTSTGTLINIFD